MTVKLPAGAPATLGAAFAYINGVTAPSILDLKIMVLLEAAGLELYRGVADRSENVTVAALLNHNGREELAHAHRVAKAIAAISGEEFLPPDAADNPYLAEALPATPATADALRSLAMGEFSGETLYETWAVNCDNAEAARLFRLNGREETDHGNRLIEAAALLEV